MADDPKTNFGDSLSAETPGRAFLARFFTIALAIVVPAMIVQIAYRWATIHEPTTAVLFSGDGSLDGTTITVISANDPNLKRTATLDQADGWQAPILLDPGLYHVQAIHRGHKILDTDCEPQRLLGVRFELPSMVIIVGDSSLADARIEIQRRSDGANAYRPGPIKLTAAEHYRVPI